MKTRILIVVMLMVLACAASVWAQPQATPQQLTKPAQPAKETLVKKTSMLMGEIVSVDTTANTITLKHKSGKTETLKIDPKVTVRKAGKIIALKDLSPGEKADVSYKTESGEKITTLIAVKVAPQKKGTPAKQKGTAPTPK